MEEAMGVNCIKWAMGPMHLSMSIVGLHFTLNKKKMVKSVLMCSYFVFITFTNLYDLFRYFQTYSYGMAFGPTLVMKFCIHVFYLSVIMGAMSQVRYSLAKDAIMTRWQEYIFKYKVKRSVVLAFRRKCILFTSIGWALTIICVLATSWELSTDDSVTEDLHDYVSLLDTPWKIALFLLHYFYSSAILSFSVFHLVSLCAGLGQEFHEIHAELKRKMDPEGGLKVELEYFRQRHRKLSEVVRQVDGIFSVYVLFSVVVNTGMTCLVTYSLFTVNTDSPSKYISIALLFLFYMAIFLIIPLSICFSGVHLHHAASSCLASLYKLDLSRCRWDRIELAQYSTFMDHLRDGRIGITGWRFFLVTKMTVKTIFIMLVSYTVILLRFGNKEYTSDILGGMQNITGSTLKPIGPVDLDLTTPRDLL